MDNTSSANLLFFDGSGTPALAKKPVFLQPGNSFTVTDTSLKVYLAGGFPGLFPQSEISLSPTLQLNGDLQDISAELLHKVALAELNRINGDSFRSFTKNPDFRVAVLAAKPDSITEFLETYGGVLEIQPFLLKNYDSEYPTIDELQVSSTSGAYSLDYTLRSPVDTALCSYCSLCGPVCPENCLNENLFLDFTRCTFCNECVKICPANAIDLYRAEKHHLEIPAIIVLDNLVVEVPPEIDALYTEETISTLFSNLIPIQIDETVSWNSSLCQYSHAQNTSCRICLDICPHGAISPQKDTLAVNHQECTECGSCLASCPTGALQYQRFTDKQFVDWFSVVPIPEKCTVILGNEEDLHSYWWKKKITGTANTLVLEYPNVKALTSMHFLFLVSLGAGRITLLDSDQNLLNKPVGRQVEQANSLIQAILGDNERVTVASPSSPVTNPTETSLPSISDTYKTFNYINRREKFASIVHFLLKQDVMQGEPGVLSGPVFDTFGSVVCDSDKCTHCGACLNDCKVDALTSDENTLSLNHIGIQCIQCGICAAVCPEDALTLNPGLSLNEEFFRYLELTRAEAMTCRECGKAFGTKKSFEHVMAKLKSHAVTLDETNFFEYCDRCRVIKLFESQQS